MKRFFSNRQRQILFWVAGGKCQVCGQKLKHDFHADHMWPFSKGGKTITRNGQALCPKCNTSKGNKEMNTKDKESRDRIKRIREIMSKKKFKVRKNALWKEPKTDEKGRYKHEYSR